MLISDLNCCNIIGKRYCFQTIYFMQQDKSLVGWNARMVNKYIYI